MTTKTSQNGIRRSNCPPSDFFLTAAPFARQPCYPDGDMMGVMAIRWA